MKGYGKESRRGGFCAVALAYQGFSYTEEETIVDIGPLEATAETTEAIPIPPVLGWVGLDM